MSNEGEMCRKSLEGIGEGKNIPHRAHGAEAFTMRLFYFASYSIRNQQSKSSSLLDSVVKLKVCYNLLTYNEERLYGGTSKV